MIFNYNENKRITENRKTEGKIDKKGPQNLKDEELL